MSVPAGWYPDHATGGQRWWDGRDWTDHYYPPLTPPPAPAAEPYGAINYVVAILIPIIGLILAITRFSKNDIGNGFGLLVASVVAFFIWLAVLAG